VNLGGTAIGTGLGAPRQYIFNVVEHLRQITGLGLARAENLIEATQNADAFVETSGMVRTLAVNLLKIANDLRLLSSGPHAGLGEIRLPPRQAGSSIMPGKVNPVIPEAVAQSAVAAIGYDQMIVQAVAGGNLELSQFLPLVADSLLTAIDLLTAGCDIFARHCVSGIEGDAHRCRRNIHNSTALLTALVDKIGYDSAEQLAEEVAASHCGQLNIRQLVIARGLLTAEEFDQLTSSERVTKLGSE
jgi:aspartate ammonia-lyase